MVSFDLVERQKLERSRRGPFVDWDGSIGQRQRCALSQNHGSLNDVLQFADVARPRVTAQHRADVVGNVVNFLPQSRAELLEEEADEGRDVFGALS